MTKPGMVPQTALKRIMKNHLKDAKRQSEEKNQEIKPKKIKKHVPKEDLLCTVCNKQVNSVDQMEQHISGDKHKDKVREQILTSTAGVREVSYKPSEDREDPVLEGLYCTVCKVTLISEEFKEGHLNGKKHKAKVANGGVAEKKKKEPLIAENTNPDAPMEVEEADTEPNKVNTTPPVEKELVPSESCDIIQGFHSSENLGITDTLQKIQTDTGPNKVNTTLPAEKALVPSESCDIIQGFQSSENLGISATLRKIQADSEPKIVWKKPSPAVEKTSPAVEKTSPVVKKPKEKVPRVKCEICDLELCDNSQFQMHIVGKKHKNKVKLMAVKKELVETMTETMTVAKMSVEKMAAEKMAAEKMAVKKIPVEKMPVGKGKKDDNSSLLDPALKNVKQDKKIVVIKHHADLDWHLRRAKASPSSIGGILGTGKATAEELWFKNNECFCGICVVFLSSTAAAQIHFTASKHRGRAKKDGEEGGPPEEWCKVCRVDLATSYAANLHYKGEKHRTRTMLVTKLSPHDEDIAERLNPMTKSGKNPDFQPGFGYLGNKRPAFSQDEGSHQGGPPPAKRGRGGPGASQHLYRSFVPGGSIHMNKPQYGPREPPWHLNKEDDYHNTQPWQQQGPRGPPERPGWQSRQRQIAGGQSDSWSGPTGEGRGRGDKPKQFKAPGAFGRPNQDKSPIRPEGQGEHCSVCNVTLNSKGQMAAHIVGAKHVAMVSGNKGANSADKPKQVKPPRAAGGPNQDKSSLKGPGGHEHCSVCNVTLNSKGQMEQHLAGAKHAELSAVSININIGDGSGKKTKVAMPVSLKTLKSVRQNAGLAAGNVTESSFVYSDGQSKKQASSAQSKEYPFGKQGYKNNPQDYSVSSQQGYPSSSREFPAKSNNFPNNFQSFSANPNPTQYPVNPYNQGFSNQLNPLVQQQYPQVGNQSSMNSYFPAGNPGYNNAPGAFTNMQGGWT